jgi:hypothetical protein
LSQKLVGPLTEAEVTTLEEMGAWFKKRVFL